MKQIPLTQGKVAVVDDADYEWVSTLKWFAHHWKTHTWYAVRRDRGRYIGMHRMILKPGKHKQIDHIDGNGLNNCRANLRVCNHAENQHNSGPRAGTSRFKGVYLEDRNPARPWRARIRTPGRLVDLGVFSTEELAAQAYDRAAIDLHGSFAYLNFGR